MDWKLLDNVGVGSHDNKEMIGMVSYIHFENSWDDDCQWANVSYIWKYGKQYILIMGMDTRDTRSK